MLGVSVVTLHAWATRGRPSLAYIRVGRLAKYRRSDIENFIESRRGTSATEIRENLASASA